MNIKYKTIWETTTFITDDSEKMTLQSLFKNYPIVKFMNTNNRMFKLMVCFAKDTFEKKIVTITNGTYKLLKPIIKWGLKYERRS